MKTLRWFGRKFPAPIYDECPQVAAPRGTDCRYCEEPIGSGDDGFIDSGNSAFHRCCFLRMIFGSIAHQEGMCGCYHEDIGEAMASTLSRREEAAAAVAFYETKQQQAKRKEGYDVAANQ